MTTLRCSGNLYRPHGGNRIGHEKLPAVLSPHGHFPGGRFQDEGRDHVRRQIARLAERFEESGRTHPEYNVGHIFL